MIRKIVIIILLMSLGCVATWANDLDTIYNLKIDYQAPISYKVAQLKVEGVKHLDKEVIKQLFRVSEGDELQIPSDDISTGMKRLYKQGLFSDIKLVADKVVGNAIYLTLKVKERPRLTAIEFTGVKKNEEKKLIEKTALSKGGYLTANMKNRIEQIVKKFFKEKGFYNVAVKFSQKPDSKDGVALQIDVDKNKVVRIGKITINGNENLPKHKLIRAMKKTKERSWRYFFRSKKYNEKEFKKDRIALIEKYNEFGFRDQYQC